MIEISGRNIPNEQARTSFRTYNHLERKVSAVMLEGYMEDSEAAFVVTGTARPDTRDKMGRGMISLTAARQSHEGKTWLIPEGDYKEGIQDVRGVVEAAPTIVNTCNRAERCKSCSRRANFSIGKTT